MYPKHHILLGFIFSVFVFILFPKIGILGVSIIFLSSFLIDVDHYIGYAIRKRDLYTILIRLFSKTFFDLIKLGD